MITEAIHTSVIINYYIPEMQKTIIRPLFFYSMVFTACIAPTISNAQRTEREIARDTITQWIYYNNVIKKKTYTPVRLADGRIYSIWQQTVSDSLQRWVQSSYNPRAAGMEIRYNKYTDFKDDKENIGPLHRYGLAYHSFPATYSKREKKLDVSGEAPEVLSIYANGPIGDYIRIFSGIGRNWYITSEPFSISGNPSGNEDDGFGKEIKNYPNISNYLHWHKPFSGKHTIVLAKDNKLPFTKVTVGEYLQAIELFTKSRATMTDANYKLPPDLVATLVSEIQKTRDRLKNNLSEPVKFNSVDGYYAVSAITNGNTRSKGEFVIYQLSPEAIELMKKDKPLWVKIDLSWRPEFTSYADMYKSFCTNFNFDYVYNYFFNPEKVNNVLYKPLHAPLQRLEQKNYVSERSPDIKASKYNAAVLFFDDFSGNAIGAEPVGWFSKQLNGNMSSKISSVQQPKNDKDLWLSLYPGHIAISNDINKPLPPNFTVSFDISCTENYTWGSSALSFFLSDLKDNDQMIDANQGLENLGRAQANSVTLKIRPAKDNTEGIEFSFAGQKVDKKFSQLRNTRRKVSSFTGERGMTKARVIIQVKGADLQISINNEKILDEKNIIPPGVIFSTMSWAALGSPMEEGDTMYLRNIKITKD
jgi:hypothetical protein